MQSNTTISYDNEPSDADIVDKAKNAISSHDLEYAESLLLGVIQNTPDNYVNSEEFDDVIYIKFWWKEDFLHYINWHKEQNIELKNIEWIGNAYPRAYYLLGHIYTEYRVLDRAIELLKKGINLEPTNPNLICEMAIALSFLDENNQALALYKSISKTSSYVSDLDAAKALRGQGFVYIELGDLIAAKDAYTLSLQFEPDNKGAFNQLDYIEHILLGGNASEPKLVNPMQDKIRSIIKKIF